jgi:FkbM family methyltransferase
MNYLKKIIRYILLKYKLRIFRIGPYSIFDFESFLYRYLAVYRTLTFLQIGANDGVMNDPIYDFNIRNKDVVSGFVLEPLPDVFELLVENYRSCPDIKPVNIAIHATQSEMTLHRVNSKYSGETHKFAKGIASFDKDHWKKTGLVPDSKFMEKIKVRCNSFSDFINSNNLDKLDLLLIDTEGYDYEILMSIDYLRIKPKIIRFEHGVRNDLMSPDQFMKICNHLNSYGYQIIAESYDATAYLLDPSDLVF